MGRKCRSQAEFVFLSKTKRREREARYTSFLRELKIEMQSPGSLDRAGTSMPAEKGGIQCSFLRPEARGAGKYRYCMCTGEVVVRTVSPTEEKRIVDHRDRGMNGG